MTAPYSPSHEQFFFWIQHITLPLSISIGFIDADIWLFVKGIPLTWCSWIMEGKCCQVAGSVRNVISEKICGWTWLMAQYCVADVTLTAAVAIIMLWNIIKQPVIHWRWSLARSLQTAQVELSLMLHSIIGALSCYWCWKWTSDKTGLYSRHH